MSFVIFIRILKKKYFHILDAKKSCRQFLLMNLNLWLTIFVTGTYTYFRAYRLRRNVQKIFLNNGILLKVGVKYIHMFYLIAI